MKKSTVLLISGILAIIISFLADAYLASKYDIQNWDNPMLNIAWIVIASAVLIAGIVMIVLSRKIAKKEKQNKQQ